MAIPKKGIITEYKTLDNDFVHLKVKMQEPGELGFVGGQYIILNSEVAIENGKVAKRAYSIISSEQIQDTFELIIKNIRFSVVPRL